jgi:hypothetical protein
MGEEDDSGLTLEKSEGHKGRKQKLDANDRILTKNLESRNVRKQHSDADDRKRRISSRLRKEIKDIQKTSDVDRLETKDAYLKKKNHVTVSDKDGTTQQHTTKLHISGRILERRYLDDFSIDFPKN